MTQTDDIGPLQGIRVIDASRVLAAPFAASMLADLGAEVIHLEHPTQLEELRTWQPVVNGVSASHFALNHSKLGVAVDIAHPEGQAILRRLLKTSDVFIENYRPGTLERFGLGRDRLEEVNPRLVHCSVRAFARGCAAETLPGYEASVQAYTGIMDITGEADGDPARCGPSVIDLGTGLSAVVAITSALIQRERTGRGSYVEPSLIRTAAHFMSYQISSYFMGGVRPQRRGSSHAALVPYRVFNCSDGPLFIAAGNDKLWPLLMQALGLADEAGNVPFPRLAERLAHRADVDRMVADAVGKLPREQLLATFRAKGIPAAPVNTLAEFVDDETLYSARVLEKMDVPEGGSTTLPGPLFGASFLRPQRRPAPHIGQHTSAVLSGIGFDDETLTRLRADGIIR